MQQVFLGGSSLGSLQSNGTAYAPIAYAKSWDADIDDGIGVVAEAGAFSHLRVLLTAAPGGADTYIFTLMVNGSPTALTCTVTGAATTAEDAANSVAVNAGDVVTMRCVGSATAAASRATYASVWTGTAPGVGFLMSGTDDEADSYSELIGGAPNMAAITHGVEAALDATITSFYVNIETALGAGDTLEVSIYTDGTIEASSTLSFAEGDTAKSVTGLAINIAPGTLLNIRFNKTAGTFAVTPGWGVGFTPDTDGESMMGGFSPVNFNGYAADIFVGWTGYRTSLGAAWTATESDWTQQAGCATGGPTWTASNYRGWIDVVPGAGDQRTFSPRIDGATGNGACVFGAADNSAQDTVNTDDIAAGAHTLSLIEYADPTPDLVSNAAWSLRQYIVPVAAGGGVGKRRLLLGVG